MDYMTEELVSIVGSLAENYLAGESTSMTYEKAEQLMGAVLYCIHEAEVHKENTVTTPEAMPAEKAYEIGAAYVEQKVKEALHLYNELLPEFQCYGNRCLYDTVVKGLPEFFRWYDVRFRPQDTILTLDYPVAEDLHRYTGIDRIYRYIVCVRLEQEFLHAFPQGFVLEVLSGYNTHSEDLIENICEIVFTTVLGRTLEGKPLSGQSFGKEDYLRARRYLIQADHKEANRLVTDTAKSFAQKYCDGNDELQRYLVGTIIS